MCSTKLTPREEAARRRFDRYSWAYAIVTGLVIVTAAWVIHSFQEAYETQPADVLQSLREFEAYVRNYIAEDAASREMLDRFTGTDAEQLARDVARAIDTGDSSVVRKWESFTEQ